MSRLASLSLIVLFAMPVAAAEDHPTYRLRYQFRPGERLEYEVTHVAKTKTRIRGAEEVSRVHTKSRRHWEIDSVDDEGQIVFHHGLDSVELTQQAGEAEEVRWSSDSGQDPPALFRVVAEQIGGRLATVTIDERGQEIRRELHAGSPSDLGMGSLSIAFPEEAIPVGHSWSIPAETKVRTENNEVKTIKIRQLFSLDRVKTGVATLSVRSEALTPIREESVRAQVIQQLSNGTIRFDIDNGRMLSKQLDWDENVVGFQGPNSLMEYNARFSERLVGDSQRVATRNKDQ